MRRLFLVVLALGLIVPLVGRDMAVAQEVGDTIDGAVWRFEMRSKARRGVTRVGQYRISNHVLYQKDETKADSEEHVVGKNHPSGKKSTMVELDGLRTFPPGDRKNPVMVSGKIKLEGEKPGQWAGVLIDQDGVHWQFRCVRVKE